MVKFKYIFMLVLLNAFPIFLTIFFIGGISEFQEVKKEELKKVEAHVINYKETSGKLSDYQFTLQGHMGVFYTDLVPEFKGDAFEDNYNTENVYTFWVESNYTNNDKQQWVEIYEMEYKMQTYLEIRDVIEDRKLNKYMWIVLCTVLCIGVLVLDISLFRIRRELI